MASMDEVRVNVYGKGGHAAQPHLNIDPVLITSHIIIALQQIVSRMVNPAGPTVLSFGKLDAKGGINIIPNEVYIEGTFRTFDEDWRAAAHTRMKKIAESISCFFMLGTGNAAKNTTPSLHSPTFNIDEYALLKSTGLMVYMALQQLGMARCSFV